MRKLGFVRIGPNPYPFKLYTVDEDKDGASTPHYLYDEAQGTETPDKEPLRNLLKTITRRSPTVE